MVQSLTPSNVHVSLLCSLLNDITSLHSSQLDHFSVPICRPRILASMQPQNGQQIEVTDLLNAKKEPSTVGPYTSYRHMSGSGRPFPIAHLDKAAIRYVEQQLKGNAQTVMLVWNGRHYA